MSRRRNQQPQTLVLASGSPRRRALIETLGVPFAVIKPAVDEKPEPDEPHLAYACRLSEEKALAVWSLLETGSVSLPDDAPAWGAVLAADTVVVLAADTVGTLLYGEGIDGTAFNRGELLEKPQDAVHAREMLLRLRGRDHTVLTAFTVKTAKYLFTEHVATTVTMRDYTDAEIEAYIATGDSLDKAGGYAIQHAGFRPVARITGCHNNVIGLPLCSVKRLLSGVGFPGVTAPYGCDCPPYTLA